MPSLNPNHRQVMAAKHVGGRRTRYSIEGVRGLVLDITPRGVRTWYVRYQIPNGARRTFRHYRIGDAKSVGLGEAIERARAVTSQYQVEAVDVFATEREARANSNTFGD